MTNQTRQKSKTNIYHVLTKGNNKNNIFIEKQDYQKYLQILSHQKQTKGFELYGYCLESNHVHLIIKQLNEPISNIIKAISISYALYFNHKYNREGHLFQGRYQSESIKDPNHLLACINYLHNYKKHNNQYTSVNDYLKNNNQLININFISFILSINEHAELINILKEPLNNDYLFIDININNIIEERAEQYIKQFLKQHHIMLYELNIPEYKPLRTKLIKYLKQQRGLSVRKIANLLNINRNTVQRVKLED